MTTKKILEPGEEKPASKRARSTKLRRKLTRFFALGFALVVVGMLYSAFAPTPQTAQAQGQPALVRKGQAVYEDTCISCHGANLEGVQDRGPGLVGIGEAAVYFQTATGRMPAQMQQAQNERKPPELSPEEIAAVSAYVQAHGGGPTLPANGMKLEGDNPAAGGDLFRLNCASCHNFTGRGGALSSGKYAPTLDGVTEQEMYAAMLTGPQNMPKFSDRQLTPDEKKNIIAYVKSVTDGNNNPGGEPLGGLGPVPEGMIAWIVGIAAVVAVTLWIGAKA
jgi:ubiquinol-cytochrome c reductase cytochrome c subunit